MRHILSDSGLRQIALPRSFASFREPQAHDPSLEAGHVGDCFDLGSRRDDLLALYPGLRARCDLLGITGARTLAVCCRCPRWVLLTLAREAQPPAVPPADDWSAAIIPDLVCHITGAHHRIARNELSRLGWIVDHLWSLHQEATTGALRTAFRECRQRLLDHLALEEESLFPLCITLSDAAQGRCVWRDQDLAALIVSTTHGHGDGERDLRKLLELARAAMAATEDPDIEVLTIGLTAMLEDLLVHSAKESELLIPQVIRLAMQLHRPTEAAGGPR